MGQQTRHCTFQNLLETCCTLLLDGETQQRLHLALELPEPGLLLFRISQEVDADMTAASLVKGFQEGHHVGQRAEGGIALGGFREVHGITLAQQAVRILECLLPGWPQAHEDQVLSAILRQAALGLRIMSRNCFQRARELVRCYHIVDIAVAKTPCPL